MRDPVAIRLALAEHKRAGVPFATAWAIVVGQVPAHGPRGEGVEHFTYRTMRAAYDDRLHVVNALSAADLEDAA